MNYRDEMTRTMTMLGQHPDTLFLGQSILFRGTQMYSTLKDVPDSKKIEMPVAEQMQMGQSIGLSLMGYVVVSIYPRMDFLLLAFDQLINHLDKIELLSEGRFKPRVIIRTSVGGKKNLNPGLQHLGDYHKELKTMCSNIPVFYLDKAEKIYSSYEYALKSEKSSILIELGDAYDT